MCYIPTHRQSDSMKWSKQSPVLNTVGPSLQGHAMTAQKARMLKTKSSSRKKTDEKKLFQACCCGRFLNRFQVENFGAS
jgi:hypothetical protein